MCPTLGPRVDSLWEIVSCVEEVAETRRRWPIYLAEKAPTKKTEDVGRNDSFIQTVSRQMEHSQGFSMLKERVLFLNCTTLVHFQFPHT